jgi:hypothetical protein
VVKVQVEAGLPAVCIYIVAQIQAGLPPVKMFEVEMEADKTAVYHPIYSLRFSLRLLCLQFRHTVFTLNKMTI